MEAEYAIKILLTEHPHDNIDKPYYWSLLKYDKLWHQIALGWEKSPEECFSEGLKYFREPGNHL
ncbi:MAG: hypothetical protein KH452_13695 [Clostridiales bacterium]|nr:hypothetical protein [Clostridiales bacterium]